MRISSAKVMAVLGALMMTSSTAHAQLTIYTDRSSWEAAVTAAAATAQHYDFTGLDLVFPDTTGVNRVTQLDTNYDNRFRIVVDRVATSPFSNPGIDLFPDANCSLGTGDCEVFTFNMVDPDVASTSPRVNNLIMPNPIIAFGGDFIQVGHTAPGGTPTGPVTLTFGGHTIVLNDYVPVPGNGFVGFVALGSGDTITFTFEQSGTITNDIFQVYNPAFALAPEGEDPADQISDLRSFVLSLNLHDGIEASLVDQLTGALAQLTLGDSAGSCAKLGDFINHVRAQRGKKIPISQANTLIADATEVRAVLGCS